MLTVITFDDEVQRGPNADEKRKRLKEAAIEVTGSDRKNVFMIANSLSEKHLDPVYKKRVLELMKKALTCGERSIKMRQTKRESPRKETGIQSLQPVNSSIQPQWSTNMNL